MIAKPASGLWQLRVPEKLQTATESAAAKDGITVADYIRSAVADKLGRPDLAATRGRGKPPTLTDAFPLPPHGLTDDENSRFEALKPRLTEEIIRAGYNARFVCVATGRGAKRVIDFRICDPSGQTSKTQSVIKVRASDFVSLPIPDLFKRLMARI